MSIQRFKIGPRMSQVVVHGDTVYLAGQVAEDTTADAKGQTEQILRQIDELLALVGTDKSKLLSATVYLSEMAHFGALNAAWEAWVDASNPPVRATVEAKLAAPKYQVEIAVIAAK
ncbi:RidA family protein [Skermanella mucosa]|uniref:RidA family protein n=1 Tax=Skermanella mucosa TaxID=1789672 RepID=UPI00192B9768|nr:RidA family protein [Skermanella mucosa]UEM24047.1 RidA family protein [Skermanella mucosa]